MIEVSTIFAIAATIFPILLVVWVIAGSDKPDPADKPNYHKIVKIKRVS